ncbi:MAG: GNAT family N-acetyltransferase [Pyrinomonadaceae bacterium]
MSIEKRIEVFKKSLTGTNFYKMFVAEDSEKGIVGFADFGKSRTSDSFEADLYAIYFLQEFQRKGIGGNIFRLCQKEMLANGLNSMSLDALELSPYRGFYEKMGGEIIGEGKHELAGIEYKTVIYGWKNLRNL